MIKLKPLERHVDFLKVKLHGCCNHSKEKQNEVSPVSTVFGFVRRRIKIQYLAAAQKYHCALLSVKNNHNSLKCCSRINVCLQFLGL